MTGEEAVNYMESVPWQGTRLGLERTRELLEKLGNPEKDLKFVHVAGTNGKGSTAAMTAKILERAGYRTGLYISPFLEDFAERMSVNGVNISGEELGAVTEAVRPAAESMQDMPTEFELMTAVAFLYFKQKKCDIVVLEVGMGGRLDSTNVIPAPEAAVICNIGLDHVKELGDTLEKIAGEKAGIIKKGCDTVLYEPYAEEVKRVVENKCAAQESPLHIAAFSEILSEKDRITGQVFSYKEHKHLNLPLLGAHQRKNAAVVLEVIEVLRARGWQIPEEAVREGLAGVTWPGRFEVLHKDPLFIADGGHNLQCAQAVESALNDYFSEKKVIFIMGILADKDHRAITALLGPHAKRFFAVTPDSPRALPAAELAKELVPFGVPVTVCDSIPEAVQKALAFAGKEDIIVSSGSLYMTGAVRAEVRRICRQEEGV